MIDRCVRIGVFILPVALMVTLALSTLRWRSSEQELAAAQSAVDSVVANASELIDLRRTRRQVSWAKRPTAVALELVNGAIERSGVSGARLVSLTEQADTALRTRTERNAPDLRRQTIGVTLDGLTLEDFGRVLESWRSLPESSVWTITSIEFHRRNGRSLRTTAATDAAYTVSLALSATYATDGN
ncbi:MAG: hypothetical protein ACF8PN_02725 [Phycisphaerales bacterium]